MQAVFNATRFALVLLTLLALLLSTSTLFAATTYVEDFEDDLLGNIQAGFATAVFNHAILGPNGFLSDDVAFPALDQPSPHHELFLGAGPGGAGSTIDHVTFTLPVGHKVIYAGVWMTGTGGGSAGVTFYGANGVIADFLTQLPQDDYEYFDTTGSGIDEVVAIDLNLPIFPVLPGNPGPESLYDDIRIKVVPEPASWMLALAALAALTGYARYRRR